MISPQTLRRAESASEKPGLIAHPGKAWCLLLLVFLAVHFAALFSPSLLDDADATHANAAQHMALSGDWVTLRVDGIRYLEKPAAFWPGYGRAVPGATALPSTPLSPSLLPSASFSSRDS
jgi:hypothetical protein